MRLLSAALAAFLATAGVAALAAPPAQIPAEFKNLQVLRKDIPRADLVQQMRGITKALGVRCTHCHVGPDDLTGMDFATDEKPAKLAARAMLRMVGTINAEFISALPPAPEPRQAVTCMTCHQGSLKPPAPRN